MSPSPAPELVVDGFPKRRPRWVELATSADHKDVGRVLIAAALGFLFLAVIDLLLMRLQLAIPENTFLAPVTFNRILSVYGATAIFLFAIPLAFGLFYYLVPLQIGSRGTALPRLGQLGMWLYVAGATVLYAGFLFTPSEAGVNPLAPLSELPYLANNGVNAWATATGMATLGFVFIAINLVATLRTMRAPGMAWRRLPVFAWAGGDLLMADAGDRPGDAGGDHDADDRPQLRRHLLQRRLRRSAAALAAPQLDLLHRRLHADPDHRLRGDRRDRPDLRPQAAVQPRRRDRLAGRRSP